MRQDYTPDKQPIRRPSADIEPLKSRSQVAVHHLTLELDEATLANLEAVRQNYELPNLDAAAQVLLAQRLNEHAGRKAVKL